MTDPRYTPQLFLRKVASPAAGVDWSLTPDTGAGWLIRSVRAVLTTSAAVASRVPTLSATDGTDEWWRAAPGALQAASLAQTYCGYPGSTGGATVAPVTAWGMPQEGLWLPQGYALRSVTALIDVADQWSGVVVQAMTFPIGAGVYQWPGTVLFAESSA